MVPLTAVALNRFGLGARPGQSLEDPVSWLEGQLSRRMGLPRALEGLPSSRQVLVEARSARRKGEEAAQALRRQWRREALPRERGARTLAAVHTRSPFRERLVAFWSNHFTVSVSRPEVAPLAGAFEREAIRPQATGLFSDLLVAVVKHPAMQLYLDNARSTGPDSPLGLRRGLGLNENLAREVLELHTLGVDGGYQQSDVEGLAGLLTGWGIDMEKGVASHEPRRQQPGPHRVLGGRYGDGPGEMERCLRALAEHPSTRKHLVRKLAVHFVDEQPSERCLQALEAAWEGSRGELATVYRALLAVPEAWVPAPTRWKSPWDLVVSAARALEWRAEDPAPLLESQRLLGQALWAAPSPAGWPDTQDAWLGPEALLRRVEWCHEVAASVGGHRNPVGLAQGLLGDWATPDLLQHVAAATSPVEGLTLVLASPAFQRR